jgi:MFS family permease
VALGFSRRFWSLIAATFLGFLGIGTVLPELGPHIRHDLGGSDQTVGFVIGIFSFVALGSRFFSGPLADNRGRKAAFMAGLFSCGLAGGAYLLPLGIPGAYAGRVFQGFGEACLYTGAAVWAVELGGIERSAQTLGYVSCGIWGGISAGPVVGHWLGSFQRAAFSQLLLAALAIALLSRVPETYRPNPHPAPRQWLPRTLIAPGLAVGFVNVHYPVIAGFLILHLARRGNAGSAAFSAYALMILFSRFFLGGLPDRIHPRRTFYFGITLMAAGLVAIALNPPAAVAVGAAAVLGFGMSFPWSSIASAVIKQTPPRDHGTAVGVLSAFYDLFVGVSAFAAGAVSTHFGYAAAFLMAAASLGAAAMIGPLVFPKGPASEPAPADQLLEDEVLLP